MVSLIDGVCQRYGQRPSDMIGITDDKIAFSFDAAIAVKASIFEKEEMEKQKDTVPGKQKTDVDERKRLENQFAKIKAMQFKAQMAQKR